MIQRSENESLPTTFDEMRSYLGKPCRVTLAYDNGKGEPVTQTGVLHQITEDGEVHIKDEAGVMHFAWPCLRVEAVS